VDVVLILIPVVMIRGRGGWTYREMVKETPAHIEISISTPRTQVPNSSLGSLASVRDRNGLSALRTGIATSILGCIQRDNIVRSDTKLGSARVQIGNHTLRPRDIEAGDTCMAWTCVDE
jgi:hypothetical protein